MLKQRLLSLSGLLQLSGTGEHHVDRTCDDFEWLQQHLYSQEDVPGIQGVIVSTSFHLHSYRSRRLALESVVCLVISAASCYLCNRLQLY